MEEINLSFNPDDPMPPGIKDDDYDSGRDIPILKELLDNYSLSLPANESYHFDIHSPYRPPAKPPDGMSGSKPFLEVPSSARATSVAGLPKSCGSCSFPSMFLTADVGWLRRVCSLVLMMSILGNAVVFATPRMMPACLYKKCYGLRKVDLSWDWGRIACEKCE
nr:hypothetical protein [Tanacetum cinerariifolium]